MKTAASSPIRILHLVDPGLTWDERLGLEHLLDRLPAEQFSQTVACLGPAEGEVRRLPAPIENIPLRFGRSLGAAPVLRSRVQTEKADLVHAWSQRAASAVCATPLASAVTLVSLFDPSRASVCAKVVRSAGSGRRIGILSATEIIRRRLVERGVPADQAVLVRPGIDFSAINRAKKSDLRTRLGVPPNGLLLVTDQPATREGGQFCAFWAAAVRSFLEPGVRVVVAGRSREADRLVRLAADLGMRHMLIAPGDGVRQEELIAVADALLVPAAEEGPVTAVAWAMAAGVPVIASATRATAELLAHQQNAFLIKPDVTKRLALRFAEALGHRREWSKLRESARGQAFEVFSLRRYADQTAQVYENLLAGRAVAMEIKDSALV